MTRRLRVFTVSRVDGPAGADKVLSLSVSLYVKRAKSFHPTLLRQHSPSATQNQKHDVATQILQRRVAIVGPHEARRQTLQSATVVVSAMLEGGNAVCILGY